MPTRTTRKVIDTYFSGNGDVLAETIEFHDQTLPEPIIGRDAVVDRLTMLYRGVFADARTDQLHVIVDGERAAAEWVFRGRHVGSLLGELPSGAEVAVPMAGVYDVEGGRIARARIYYDGATMLRQMGVSVAVGGPASPITGG